MRTTYELANMSAPDVCTRSSARFAAEPWRCVLGLQPLAALSARIPVFVEQSALDRWQTGCVLGATPSALSEVGCSAGEWEECLQYMTPLLTSRARRQCKPSQLLDLDQFSHSFMRVLTNHSVLHRPGSGAFLHGCHSHCPSKLGRFVVGSVSLERALLEWWRAPASAPARRHRHIGCLQTWAGGTSATHEPPCRPICSTLYPWPDHRRRKAARDRAIEFALHGQSSSGAPRAPVAGEMTPACAHEILYTLFTQYSIDLRILQN